MLDRVRSRPAGEDELAHYRVRLPALAADAGLAARAGARVVVPGDDEWPTALEDLGDRVPIALWVAGAGNLADAARRSVSVVGARACTAYGEHVAGELAAALGDRGWTVVSGGAYGIDAAAHQGAGRRRPDGGRAGLQGRPLRAARRLLRAIRGQGVVVSSCRRSRPRRRFLDATGSSRPGPGSRRRGATRNRAAAQAATVRASDGRPRPGHVQAPRQLHELIRARGAAGHRRGHDVSSRSGALVADAQDLRREAEAHDGLDR